MYFFQSVNLLQKTEIPAYPAGSPDNSSQVNGAPFADFLNQHLDDNTVSSNENNHYIENENSINDREIPRNDISANNDRKIRTEDKNSATKQDEKAGKTEIDGKRINFNEKESVDRSAENKEENTETVSRKKGKIAADKSEKNEKIEMSNPHKMDLSALLKDILTLIDNIKENSLDKEQVKELKTALLEIKEQLFTKKDEKLQSRELVSILNKLKHILKDSNKKINIPFKDEKEIFDIAELKKEITKHIRSLSEKPQKIAVSDNDAGNINKNSNNQKLQTENTVTEAKDFSEIRDSSGSNKENSSNNNFQFLKKDGEISQPILRNNVQSAAGKNNFSEQLDKIVQNAKIYVKDSKNGSFSLRLHPESLGRVNVNLNLEQGVIIGKFLVDTSDAKDALMENMAAVKERLQDSGIAVGDFQVNVRDQNSSSPDFEERQFLYVDSGNQNASVNTQYELNAAYYHDGEIDFVI